MQNVGVIDAAMMNNANAISVLVCGFVVGHYIYPWLEKRGIYFPLTYKFAVGTFIGLIALLSAVNIDYQIHSKFNATGEKVNIMW